MNVINWNCSKFKQSLTGIKRYEDELYNHINTGYPEINIVRIHRPENSILGSTIFSWLLTYSRKNADINHATCQTIAPVIYFTRSPPSVITVLDIVPLIYPSTKTNLAVTLQWSLIPSALQKINRIITISEFTKTELIKVLKIPEERISPVYLGVDHSAYHPQDREHCKKMFGLSTEEQHILVVASNLYHKRMDLAQKIIEDLCTRHNTIRMIKSGYGEQLRGKGIINLGIVPEEKMPMLYGAADVYLHTSEYEGFGLPILEAMACGTPVVASNRASIPEIIGNSGDLIEISSNNCIQLFVQAIEDKIDLGIDKSALEQSKKFSWDKMTQETVNIYEEIYNTSANISS
jgi:glycosyltransferase involved in cell wall biosynthesis